TADSMSLRAPRMNVVSISARPAKIAAGKYRAHAGRPPLFAVAVRPILRAVEVGQTYAGPDRVLRTVLENPAEQVTDAARSVSMARAGRVRAASTGAARATVCRA